MKCKVVVNENKCKGCRLCVDVCPEGILVPSSKNNRMGIYVVQVKKHGKCRGCIRCAIICPDVAIEVYR